MIISFKELLAESDINLRPEKVTEKHVICVLISYVSYL